MRFFSKVIFICNISFVIAVILRVVENANKKEGIFDGAIKFQPLESTLVVMGYGAIFLNLIFNLILATLLLTKAKPAIASWLLWTNFIFLIAQIIYFTPHIIG